MKKTIYATNFLSLAALAPTTLVIGFESIVRPHFPRMEHQMIQHGGGFDWVNHEVHTDDGYILNVFRLVPWGYDSDHS